MLASVFDSTMETMSVSSMLSGLQGVDMSLLQPITDSELLEDNKQEFKIIDKKLSKIEFRSDEFKVEKPDYTQQFSGIYYTRLNELRPRVIELGKQRWTASDKSIQHVDRVLDVESGKACFIVGTVYVEQTRKPNVLTDIAKEQPIVYSMKHDKYADQEDEIILEDESGRVTLVGEPLKGEMFTTGIIVGILGCEIATGDFEVIDILYPETNSIQKPIPKVEDDKYIAIVSGLSRNGNNDNSDLALLSRFLRGDLGHSEIVKNITTLFVAGNSLEKPSSMIGSSETASVKMSKGVENIKFIQTLVSSLEQIDTFFNSLCNSMNVIVIPGEQDPANIAFPQQPLKQKLFNKSSQSSTFICQSNPIRVNVDEIDILGTSGQNVDSIYDGILSEDRLCIARNTLRWGHLAPTAPDTLWSFPFSKRDPLLLRNGLPHIYFIGNQPEFKTTQYVNASGEPDSMTRVVLVPSFTETKSFVLISLRTLEAIQVTL